jgi:hypothetical protein
MGGKKSSTPPRTLITPKISEVTPRPEVLGVGRAGTSGGVKVDIGIRGESGQFVGQARWPKQTAFAFIARS